MISGSEAPDPRLLETRLQERKELTESPSRTIEYSIVFVGRERKR